MEEKTCATCSRFRQHYIKLGRSYHAITYGHCVYPALKKRESATPACQKYQSRSDSIISYNPVAKPTTSSVI